MMLYNMLKIDIIYSDTYNAKTIEEYINQFMLDNCCWQKQILFMETEKSIHFEQRLYSLTISIEISQ